MDFWQHIPETLDPIAFSLGSFSIRWYAVFFLVGWASAFAFLSWRIRRKEFFLGKEALLDLAFVVLTGAVLGGRLGYALWYDPSLLRDPVLLVTPIDTSGEWTGIRGMSFHGAVLGAIAGLFFVARAWKVNFLSLADFVVPSVPMALFFGRIGNFINIELFGRVTEKPWGMYFPGQSVLRHPSQLYEAFFEGVMLFLLLSSLRGRHLPQGALSAVFLGAYGAGRFFIEFFREPDNGIALLFGWMTLGQALSVAMILISCMIFLWIFFRKNATIVSKT